ncbi:MAG TPA: hypothetical protein VK254_00110 [Candidatus Bathyarchaeia archaeon]|nr:hypothetical protein [Candidatus Bathyarchaeia archaeon]
MKQAGVDGQQTGYAEHIQDLIDTHLSLVEMLVSRLISRNPQCCPIIARLKCEQKTRKEKSSVFPLYRGIINMYAPMGWQFGKGEVSTTPIIISLKTWFAEKINFLDLLSNHGSRFTDFDVDEDSVFFTVMGPTGLSMFQGIFIDHIKNKFTGFDMPWHIGLDTEVTTNAQRYFRLQV